MKSVQAKRQKSTHVFVEVLLIPDGDYITALCPALELSSFGRTNNEAKVAFKEALDTLLEDIVERKTLETVLLDLGWTLRKVPSAYYQPPSAVFKRTFVPKIPHISYVQSFSIPV